MTPSHFHTQTHPQTNIHTHTYKHTHKLTATQHPQPPRWLPSNQWSHDSQWVLENVITPTSRPRRASIHHHGNMEMWMWTISGHEWPGYIFKLGHLVAWQQPEFQLPWFPVGSEHMGCRLTRTQRDQQAGRQTGGRRHTFILIFIIIIFIIIMTVLRFILCGPGYII